jgi:hypothetical protein
LAFLLLISAVRARDSGQWQYQDPSISDYFKSLMQPDQQHMSCCGFADAYYADQTEVGPNGETIAIITDSRDDGPLMRAHIPVGTKIPVPPSKIRKHPIYNPTGHTLIFIGTGGVFCYEPLPLF